MTIKTSSRRWFLFNCCICLNFGIQLDQLVIERLVMTCWSADFKQCLWQHFKPPSNIIFSYETAFIETWMVRLGQSRIVCLWRKWGGWSIYVFFILCKKYFHTSMCSNNRHHISPQFAIFDHLIFFYYFFLFW